MTRLLLVALTIAMSLAAPVWGQHTQSLSFSSPGPIIPGQQFMVSVNLAFGGYSSFGFSYWLEVSNNMAPFLFLDNVERFTFPDPRQPILAGTPFNSTAGSTAGFMLETPDLGATVNDPTMKMVPPGTYHITDITLRLAAGAPFESFTLRSTTVSPRVSEVTDTDFNDNNIIPAGSITFNVIPEPSTLALLAVTAVGVACVAYRRRKLAR